MLIPERHGNSDDYRYGFNGKENDNNIKGTGNSVDFGSRMYDSRLGRWFAVDPLFKDYPHLSPYNYTANNPILFIDIDGKKLIVPKEAEKLILSVMKYAFGDNNGFEIKNGLLFHNGNVPKNMTSEQNILFELINEVLINNSRKVYIAPNQNANFRIRYDTEKVKGAFVEDNTLLTLSFPDYECGPNKGPKAIIEGYEIILIPTEMLNKQSLGLDTENGVKAFSLEHLVLHEIGHAIFDIIKRSLHGKYKNINVSDLDIDGEKFDDYAIRFTNTLLKSLNKTLETGAGQHGRDKGKKPPKEDVSPLKDLEEENNSDK